METVGDGLDQKLIQSQAMIIQGSLICVKTPPITVKDDDVLRDSVDELLEFVLRPCTFFDINHGYFSGHARSLRAFWKAFREECAPLLSAYLSTALWRGFEFCGRTYGPLRPSPGRGTESVRTLDGLVPSANGRAADLTSRDLD